MEAATPSAGLVLSALVVLALIAASAAAAFRERGGQADDGEEPTSRERVDLSRALRDRLGLMDMPAPVFGFFVLVWLFLFLTLLFGLLSVGVAVWETAIAPADEGDARWTLALLAAVTAALGGVVALPFTLLRSRDSARQTIAAEEGLLTDRINKAVEGLGAEKVVNRLGRSLTFTLDGEERSAFEWTGEPLTLPERASGRRDGEWRNVGLTEPNLEVRLGAIYALERIAQRNLGVHVQIMEILCAYIRQNAPLKEKPDPLQATVAQQIQLYRRSAPPDIQASLSRMARRLPSQREMEARTLVRELPPGRPAPPSGFIFDRPPASIGPVNKSGAQTADWRVKLGAWEDDCQRFQGYRLDLRETDLSHLDLWGLNLAGAQLQGARLDHAKLSHVRLAGALMQEAKLRFSYVLCASLEGAWLDKALLQSALLHKARFDRAILTGAQLQRAKLSDAQLNDVKAEGAQLQEADLAGAWLCGVTLNAKSDLRVASTRGAALRATDFSQCIVEPRFFEDAFGDGSVKGLPEGYVAGEPPLEDWSPEVLGDETFYHAWRAWQVEIGYRKPDDPT